MTSPHRATTFRFDHNFILNLFIAIVAVSTFLLVCYLVLLPSMFTKITLREQPEDGKEGGEMLERHLSRLEQDRYILDKIPDFKQSRLLQSVKKKHLKQKVKDNVAPSSLAANVRTPLPASLKSPAPPSLPQAFSRSSAPPSSVPSQAPLLPTASPPPHLPPHPQPPSSPSPPSPSPLHMTAPPFIPLSSVSEQQCKQEYCSEFLTSDDLARWKTCSLSAGINNTLTESQEGTCRFIDQPHREAVALVSFAGSGNTWVRGLLEAATGICTGAVYCDISLRGKGFAGEHTRGGQALVVKTHSSSSEWVSAKSKMEVLKERSGLFGSAILLVRNPFDALVAEWNRKVANNFRDRTTVLDSHTKAAGQEWFGRNTMWDSFVQLQMTRWQDVIKNWFLFNTEYPVLVVTYEALKNDTCAQVSRILDFLNIGYDTEVLKERLDTSVNTFLRKKHPQEFQHFTKQQRVYVSNLLKDISSLLSISDIAHILNVEQYYPVAN